MPASSANPALQTILADYQRYHFVLVIVGTFLLLGVAALVVSCWRRLRRARRSEFGATRRQRWTYGLFVAGGILVALFLALVVVANISTVLDPARGFEGVRIDNPSFNDWVASGSASIPAEVQRLVDARLSWQRPKAITVTVLLVAAVLVSVWIWRRWVTRAFASRLANSVLLVTGIGVGAITFLLMLMVMGNTQAAIAPVAMTLVFG